MYRVIAIALLLGFAAACQCTPCDRVSCGCSASSGECLPGTHTLACGVDGQRCSTCRAGEEACSNGGCVPDLLSGVGGRSGGGAATGGGSAGGVAGGAPQPFGDLLANVGRPCTAFADMPGGECSAELTCLPVVGTSRFACQFACASGMCGGTGRCQLVVEANRSCTDCLRPCVLGGSSCLADEVCLPRAGGNVCMPNCRFVGAKCPGSQQCMHDGFCSQGGLVSYCLRF